jgi:hypothetical protein
MENDRDSESCATRTAVSMRGLGKMINDMARAMKDSAKETAILANFKTDYPPARESTTGQMESCTMASGKKGLNTVTAFGGASIMSPTSASGRIQGRMATASTLGKLGTGTRDSGLVV